MIRCHNQGRLRRILYKGTVARVARLLTHGRCDAPPGVPTVKRLFFPKRRGLFGNATHPPRSRTPPRHLSLRRQGIHPRRLWSKSISENERQMLGIGTLRQPSCQSIEQVASVANVFRSSARFASLSCVSVDHRSDTIPTVIIAPSAAQFVYYSCLPCTSHTLSERCI